MYTQVNFLWKLYFFTDDVLNIDNSLVSNMNEQCLLNSTPVAINDGSHVMAIHSCDKNETSTNLVSNSSCSSDIAASSGECITTTPLEEIDQSTTFKKFF